MSEKPEEPSLGAQLFATVFIFIIGFWLFGGSDSPSDPPSYSKPSPSLNTQVKDAFVGISVLTEACSISSAMRGDAMTVLIGLAQTDPDTVSQLQPVVDAAVAELYGKTKGEQVGTCLGYEDLVRRLL